MKQSIILIMALILLVPLIYSDELCTVTIDQNNISVHDFIEPDGEGADCVATIRQDNVIVGRVNMSRDELFYNASFDNLGFTGEYTAFIDCNTTDDVFFSACDFLLDEDMLKINDCPDKDLPSILMFIFIFIILVTAYIFSRMIVKFPIVEIMIGIGFLIYSITLLGCNNFIGAIGILSSIAMMLVAVLGR